MLSSPVTATAPSSQHQSAHFVVRCPPGATARARAEQLAATLERTWEGMVGVLGAEAMPREPVNVVLRAPGTPGEAAAAGVAAVAPGGLLLQAPYRPRAERRSAEELRWALVTLLLARGVGERAARCAFLVDGLLAYTAIQAGTLDLAKLQADVARRRRRKRAVGLAELLDGATARNRQAYGAAIATFMAYLAKAYGGKRLKQLALALNEGGPAEALVAVYRVPLATLERDWLAALPDARENKGLGWVIGRCLVYWRPYWRQALLIALAGAVQALFISRFSDSLKQITDLVKGKEHAGDAGQVLAVLALELAGLYVVNIGATVFGDFLAARTSVRILNDVRHAMFAHLQRLSMGYFSHAESGDIVARFTGDLSDIDKGVTSRFPDGLTAVVSIAIYAGQILVYQPILFAAMALATPLVLVATRFLSPGTASATYRMKKEQAALATMVQENVKAQPVVKVFGLHDAAMTRLRTQLASLFQISVRANFFSQEIGTISNLGVTLIQVGLVLFGALLVIRGEMSAGALFGATLLITQETKAAYDLTKKVIPSLISSSGALRRVDELLYTPAQVADAPDAAEMARLAREIRCEGVSFGYGPDKLILDQADLTIRAGQYVALVGPSGSGKSTILSLIMRFYDPTAGMVTFDGRDLRAVTQDSLRRQMAAVFQDTFLFNASVRENIRMGKRAATDEEIEAAAKRAEIHDLITTLPQGYDTVVGEGGGLLSGGQRQRVCIARAIVRDPAILVLDEPTSALDPSTEASINATLERLASERTVVAVTHRLASVQRTDRIFVLRDGRVVEQGRHAELLARRGFYRQLWEKQQGFAVSEDGNQATMMTTRLQALPLHSVPIFARLDAGTLEAVGARLVSQRYEAGQVIVEEGQACRTFFVIARGQVEVLTHDPRAGERQVDVLDDGDYFGENALFVDTTYLVTVRALEPTICLTLRREDFLPLLEGAPALRAAVEQVRRRIAAPVVTAPEGEDEIPIIRP